jgi:uncharacterized protein YjbJ (UPF0337 family)
VIWRFSKEPSAAPPRALLDKSSKEQTMNWDRIEGNWKQVKGKVKTQWGKLTDDDFDVIGGRRDELAGKIQERYGVAKDDAERQVSDWERGASDEWFVTDRDSTTPPRV